MCTSPIRSIWINGTKQDIPCGQCMECRMKRAREWAIRMYHESQMHKENSFLTLTYSDENIPEGKTLVKSHLQLFFKRLRSEGYVFRYFACGEYGDETHRPHYHVIFFGFDPDYIMNRSAYLDVEKIWGYGHIFVGDFSFKSANYVSKYITKRITGPKADAHYKGRLPEFILMSRNPGLGSTWYDKYGSQRDTINIRGAVCSLPRYYKNKQQSIEIEHSRLVSSRKRYLEQEKDLLTRSCGSVREYVKISLERRKQKNLNIISQTRKNK